MDWNGSAAFINQHRAFHDLHLLPTGHQTIRKMSSQILVFKHVDKATVAALTRLGIHSLHPDLSQKDPLLQMLVKDSFAVTPQIRSYINFLANNFVIDKLIGLRAQDHPSVLSQFTFFDLCKRKKAKKSDKAKN